MNCMGFSPLQQFGRVRPVKVPRLIARNPITPSPNARHLRLEPAFVLCRLRLVYPLAALRRRRAGRFQPALAQRNSPSTALCICHRAVKLQHHGACLRQSSHRRSGLAMGGLYADTRRTSTVAYPFVPCLGRLALPCSELEVGREQGSRLLPPWGRRIAV